MSVPTETRCTACGRTATTADRYCGHCGARLDPDGATPPADAAETTGAHRPHVDRMMAALRSATMGEYDIAGELGRGGMAVVFLAHDLSLNRKVAIKVLLPELLYTEGMDRRFKHEARIAAKLDHPNILVIHGVREANELLFIVMKLVEGLPLSAIARATGPLPVPIVRLIIRHVAEALAYAHGEGVVHRDVKPANIMVDRRGNVIVMDFGIAKAADDAHLTRTGLVIGTPAYMSPEQCLAHGVAPASDQYSLGVVAYELLTGQTPFRGSSLEMQWAHATAGPPGLRTVRSDCPPALESLVMRMLAKAPADRWPTLHEVGEAVADDPATASAARAALVALVNDAPGSRGDVFPVTPASPLPIGAAPAIAGNATTQPADAAANPAPRSAPTTDESAGREIQPGAGGAPPLTLSQQRIELATGDSVELIVELAADDQPTTGATVQWASSDPGVALVSTDGFVTAVAPGLAEIACSWRGKRAVCLVNVSAAPAAAVAPATPATPAPARSRAESQPEETPVPAMSNAAGQVAAAAASSASAPHAPASTPSSPASAPSSRAHYAGAHTTPPARPRQMWWMGVLAAGVVGVALYAGLQGSSGDSSAPPTDLANAQASAPARSAPSNTPPVPPSSAVATSSADSVAPNDPARRAGGAPPEPTSQPVVRAAVPRAPTTGTAGRAPVSTGGRARDSAATSAAGRPAVIGARSPVTSSAAPPAVPLPRPDTLRLTPTGSDSARYAPTRPAAPASPPPAAASPSYSPPAPARDSAPARLPAPTRDVASALFREFSAAINRRVYSRITTAYSQPSDPGEVKLWQDFLLLVRDYAPLASVRATTVDATTNPPTITATIDFRWTSDAGFDRVRAGTFIGVGHPIPDGWELRGVRLVRKFW